MIPIRDLDAVLNTTDETQEEQKDDEEIEIQEEQEAEPLAISNSPSMPTAAEVEEHRVTHIHFLRWCRECMMGRGTGEQRGRHQGREHAIAILGLDYFYITSRGIETRSEMALEYPETVDGTDKLEAARKSGIVVKCLIARCHQSKNIFGHVIQCKGVDEDKYVVDLVVKAVQWLGHVKIILKSDNEKAILALVSRALSTIRCNVMEIESVASEQSAKYDRQSNGGAEVGIRII